MALMIERNRSKPAVAIIMRTKNRPLLLERAIKSTMGQSYANFILVIVNDGGDPKPIEKLISKYKINFKNVPALVNNKESIGHGGACNVGLHNSDSKYIVMFDDDDTWHKDFLKTTVGYLESTDSFGVVTASEVVFESIDKNDNIKFLKKQPFLPDVKEINLFSMLGSNQFPNLAFVYRREALKKVGEYDNDASPQEDWDFNIRFLANYDIHFINEPLVYYHHRVDQPGNLGNSIFVINFHSNKNNYLLNKYLREDLSKGVLGVGFLANISQQMLRARSEDLTYLTGLLRQSTTETHDGINALHRRLNDIEHRLEGILSKVNSFFSLRARKYLKNALNKKN